MGTVLISTPGDVSLDPSFGAAIYENLLQELAKTKQFKQVFRSSDRNANDVPGLLILKTTVQTRRRRNVVRPRLQTGEVIAAAVAGEPAHDTEASGPFGRLLTPMLSCKL